MLGCFSDTSLDSFYFVSRENLQLFMFIIYSFLFINTCGKNMSFWEADDSSAGSCVWISLIHTWPSS